MAGALGAFVEARGVARLAGRLPGVLRDATRTGTVAALLILGAGAAVAGMAVAVSGGDAGQIIDDYHTGVAGQVGLVMVCGFYSPDVAAWSASYLVGPGFEVGTETTISAAQVSMGPAARGAAAGRAAVDPGDRVRAAAARACPWRRR